MFRVAVKEKQGQWSIFAVEFPNDEILKDLYLNGRRFVLFKHTNAGLIYKEV